MEVLSMSTQSHKLPRKFEGMPLLQLNEIFRNRDYGYIVFLSFLIKFIRVTLVHRVIEVSGVRFYDTSSIHYIVCPPPKVTSSSITIQLAPFTLHCSPTPFSLVNAMLLSVSMSFIAEAKFSKPQPFGVAINTKFLWRTR